LYERSFVGQGPIMECKPLSPGESYPIYAENEGEDVYDARIIDYIVSRVIDEEDVPTGKQIPSLLEACEV
jgi:hypothetical protein